MSEQSLVCLSLMLENISLKRFHGTVLWCCVLMDENIFLFLISVCERVRKLSDCTYHGEVLQWERKGKTQTCRHPSTHSFSLCYISMFSLATLF